MNPHWHKNAAANVGAATWGNGAVGVKGAVSATNSLVGSVADDYAGNLVPALSNGNYVVSSPNWHLGALANVGAATWRNGATGASGVISADNSWSAPRLVTMSAS